MFEINFLFDEHWEPFFRLEPICEDGTHEHELGMMVIAKERDYCVGKDGKIYKSVHNFSLMDKAVKLLAMHAEAQGEFSREILKLREKAEEYKHLKKLNKKRRFSHLLKKI